MSYRLVRMHWSKYKGSEKVADLYSYHVDEKHISEFIHSFKEEVNSDKEFHYSPGCRGYVPVSGKLYAEAKASVHGVWAQLENQPA